MPLATSQFMSKEFFSGDSSKIFKWIMTVGLSAAVIVGIAFVLNVVFFQALTTFYPEPQYEDFCGDYRESKQIQTEEQCLAGGGQWTEHTDIVEPVSAGSGQIQPTGWCDADFTCRQEFDDAREDFNEVGFIVIILLGIAALIIGSHIKKSAIVAVGVSIGGVFAIIISAARFWSDTSDVIRLVLLLIALGVLVWIGMKKFGDS